MNINRFRKRQWFKARRISARAIISKYFDEHNVDYNIGELFKMLDNR